MEPSEQLTSTRESVSSPTAEPGEGKNAGGQKGRPQKGWAGFLGFCRELVELVVVTLVLLIAIRWALAEARYIPSSSMEPTLQIQDRLLVEKISGHLQKPIHRGDILVLYPPQSELGGQELSNDPL